MGIVRAFNNAVSALPTREPIVKFFNDFVKEMFIKLPDFEIFTTTNWIVIRGVNVQPNPQNMT